MFDKVFNACEKYHLILGTSQLQKGEHFGVGFYKKQ
jgi:hypothetical protein